MNIDNLITKKKHLDRRRKIAKIIHLWFNRYTRAAAVAGVIVGSLIAFSIYYSTDKNTSLKPVGRTINVKPKEVEAKEERHCGDAISYIRCSGEDLGKSNKTIMTMIRIAKKESNLNPRAKNPKSTASGVFQITAGTWYSNDCVGDKWNFKDNTDCAWKIQSKRGFQPWEVWNKGLIEK